jgi:hypothetical protein
VSITQRRAGGHKPASDADDSRHHFISKRARAGLIAAPPGRGAFRCGTLPGF